MEYLLVRHFGADVHVFIFDPNEQPTQIARGTPGKLEPLSAITHDWYEKNGYVPVAKINFGFFNPAEHYGWLYRDSGFEDSGLSRAIECYMTKDNQFIVEDITPERLKYIKGNIKWGGGLSYSLVIDGKKDIRASQYYAHSKNKEPRTLIGQRPDKKMVWAVVDGRRYGSIGLTASESADVMLQLGCHYAINADGGGSSQMMVMIDGKMQTVNKPSDGRERNIGTALIAFGKKGTRGVETAKLMRPLIAVDDGHGRETTGKRTPVQPDGKVMLENEFNSAVAKYLIEELHRCGFRTIETAPGDKDAPLADRVRLANDAKADFFLSIHANAYKGVMGNHGGIETYVWPKGDSERIGKIIHAHILKGTPKKDRGVKDGSHLYVIRNTRMPAVLTELGFMDSIEDVDDLRSDAYRRECATELAMALCEAFNMTYVPAPAPQPSKPTPTTEPNVLWKVQVGAFGVLENAERKAEELRRQGEDVFIVKTFKEVK